MKTLPDKMLKDIAAEPFEIEKLEKPPVDPVAVILKGIRSELIAIREKLDEPTVTEKAPDMTGKFDRMIGLLEKLTAMEKKEPEKPVMPMPCDYDFDIVRDGNGDMKTVKARVVT